MTLSRIRRRGADMTQSLLYVSYAIIVLIGVLAVYEVVNRNTARKETAQILTNLSAEFLTWPRGWDNGTFTQDHLATIAKAGAFDPGLLSQENGTSVLHLPYGARATYTSYGSGGHTLVGTIMFDPANHRGVSLCNYLIAGAEIAEMTGRAISGPLGAEYVVEDAQCTSDMSYINYAIRPNTIGEVSG